MCNGRVLRKSGIYRLGQIGINFPLNSVVINDMLLPTIILKD